MLHYWMSSPRFWEVVPYVSINKITSMGLRQNTGTHTGILGKIFGLFPYYDIYLQVMRLDGLAVIFPTKPYLGV
jgi:hypothetical protein